MNWKMGDVASWVGALGTTGAFVVALWQIRVERRARMRLERQGWDNERAEQAQQVSAWVARETPDAQAWIAVLNGSDQPVYEAIASVVPLNEPDELGARTPHEYRGLLSIVPPGRYYVKIRGDYRGMHFHPAVVVAFTDKTGLHWIRDARGRLVELDRSAPDFLQLDRPLVWALPEVTDLDVS